MKLLRLTSNDKPVIFLLVVVSFVLFIAGCKNGKTEWDKFEDREMGFSFNYPSDWYVIKKPLDKGSYQDYLAITSYRPVRSYSDRAPHLNFPNGGVSIVLHWQYAPGVFPYKPGPSKKDKASVDLMSLGKRGYVNRLSSQIPPPYMSANTMINGRMLSLELRTDKEGKKLGEKIFKKIIGSFKFAK